LLGIKPSQVGIKAKTPEGLNLDNAAIAHVAVLLMPAPSKKRKSTGNKKKKKKTGK
jgi:2-C-methyl-D-erythritol 2,4-cyclodiphosphate synthase